MTRILKRAYCEVGTALAFAQAPWVTPCCTEELLETKIFAFPFWKREDDADVLVRITIHESDSGLSVGRIGALRHDSVDAAEKWVSKPSLKEDNEVRPLLIVGKRISKDPFVGCVECGVEFEIFDGCDKMILRL